MYLDNFSPIYLRHILTLQLIMVSSFCVAKAVVKRRVCNLAQTSGSLGDSHSYFCITPEKLLPLKDINLTTKNNKIHFIANLL